MPEAVYRMMTLLCALVSPLPVGTNVGVLHLLWMLVSGQLLSTRGAIIPGLSACGLAPRTVRRAWAALGHGAWSSAGLLRHWQELVAAEGRWQAHTHGGYHPVGVDVTAYFRPCLQRCPTTHYCAEAGRALPAIPVGLIGRIGSVGHQRLALPLAFVRTAPADPRTSTHERRLVRAAVQQCQPDDALVLDAGFGLALLQAEGATRYVVRCAKNATFRRPDAPAYQGRGRPPTRGALVRPLPRAYRHKVIPATPPDRTATWTEDGVVVRAEVWTDLQRADTPAQSDGPPLTVVAVHDPRYREPLLLASSLSVPPHELHALYRDRWPVEQLPLAAKQMRGAARQFVSAPETCQRLPALALLAGAILSYAAATAPARPASGIAIRSRPPAGCAVLSPVAIFRMTFRFLHDATLKARPQPICRRASGANAGAACPQRRAPRDHETT